MKTKKILIYILAVLILAGIIIISIKGFNVDFMLQKHDSIEYIIGKDFEIKDIENISKEVFGDKKFVLKKVEVFDDAISINAKTITEEEKNLLIEKLDQKYKNGEKTEGVLIVSTPQIRLRELIYPYVVPTIIAFAIIYLIEEILICKKYKKSYLKLIKITVYLIVTQLAIFSLIAIVRTPITYITIPVALFIAMAELIILLERINRAK